MARKTGKGAPTDTGASARERILAEAERVFGARGFEGASMRELAEAAGVPLALVSYHFGSKEGVYRAVFERRAPVVVEQRLAGLAIAMSEPNLDRRLELVVKALGSALPDRPEAEIWWAYQFMLGAMVHVMRDVGRLERLSGGLCRPDDEAAAVGHMVAFLTAGMRHGRRAPEASAQAAETKKPMGGKKHAIGDIPKGRRRVARGSAG